MKKIRTQIMLGMSFREVAESLTRREFNHRSINAQWMERFLDFAFKENNHSIQFRSRKMPRTMYKAERARLSAAGIVVEYWKGSEFEDPHAAAEEDMKRLNRIILDLYEIKKHAPPSQENKSEALEVGQQIRSLKKKIEEMKVEIENLERRKRELS